MIWYSSRSHRTAAVAKTLAAVFDLCCVPRGAVDERRAALTVAEASERRHHAPATPVVVVPPGTRVKAGGPIAPPLVRGLTVEDRALARDMIGSVACVAGLEEPTTARRVLRGTPGPTLAAVARAHDAALVVVSASVRPLLVRALLGSATRYLARRSDRLLVVCPRDPRPAMRLREALTPSPTHSWWSR